MKQVPGEVFEQGSATASQTDSASSRAPSSASGSQASSRSSKSRLPPRSTPWKKDGWGIRMWILFCGLLQVGLLNSTLALSWTINAAVPKSAHLIIFSVALGLVGLCPNPWMHIENIELFSCGFNLRAN